MSIVVIGSLAVLLASASHARAREPEAKIRCKASYESAQVLKADQKLAEARAQIAICRETCPAPLVAECVAWQREIAALMPTVRIAIRDPQGARVDDARVLMDGRLIPNPSESFAVDPGAHVIRVEPRRGSPVETREQLHPAERDRIISVTITPESAAAAAAPPKMATTPVPEATGTPRRSPTPSWILGGIGVASLAVAGGLTIKGHVDRAGLGDCKPFCEKSDADAIKTLWYTAGALAVVGGVAFVTAIVLWPRSVSSRVGASPSLRWSAGELSAHWQF